jgi:DNA transposition AAA+ family ATPase
MSTHAPHIAAALEAREGLQVAPAEARGFSPETAAQIHQHRETSGLSWAHLSRAMGMSDGTLHQCVHGTYKGNPEAFEQKALSYFAMLQLRENAPHDIFETEIAKQFLEVVKAAKGSGEAVLVTHLPGVGASIAATLYARNDSTAILITARRGIRSGRGAILHDLRRTLTRQKWRRKDERAGTLAEDVVRRLSGSGRVIVIDHADELTKDAISFILSIREETGCAVILMGAPRLHEKIEAVGEGDARPAAVGLWRELRFSSASALSAAIHNLCRVLAPEHAEDLRRPAYQAAREAHGNLRAIAQRLRLTVTLTKGERPVATAWDHARLRLVSTTTAAERIGVMEHRRREDQKTLNLPAA